MRSPYAQSVSARNANESRRPEQPRAIQIGTGIFALILRRLGLPRLLLKEEPLYNRHSIAFCLSATLSCWR